MAKYERLTAGGVWVEMTKEEAWESLLADHIDIYGEEEGRKVAEREWVLSHTPPELLPAMTEGERVLADRMQAEHEMSVTLARMGYKSILDLPGPDEYPDPLAPSDDDDEEVEIDLRGAREYDYEAAAALTARKARERARGSKGDG